MQNSTAEFWAGSGGDEYLARNRVDWRLRIPFWKDVIERTGARSVYEVGCNAGWNLSAIKRAFPDVRCAGSEINALARLQAQATGLYVYSSGAAFETAPHIELVFTAGVLIHIEPAKLQDMMEQIIALSAQYVLAIEYAADEETEVEYRGQRGLLWKRPFGKLYEELGLRQVVCWDAGPGFDNCTAWLMEKI